MSEVNEAVMRRFIDEVINNADYAALRELVHPDYVYRSPDQELRGPQALEAQVYDPAFYIAFDAVLPSGVAGTECAPETRRADLDAANAALDAALRAAGGAVAAEEEFPRVGALFADTLMFACAR